MTNQKLLCHVAYCGLYCGLCAHRIRIPQQASQLQKSLHEEGFDNWYQYVPDLKDTFPPFWQFLQKLAEIDAHAEQKEDHQSAKSANAPNKKALKSVLDAKITRARLSNPLQNTTPH
jgi:hypothetical protein